MSSVSKSATLIGAAGVVGSGTIVSRITGFARDVFIAALLGAGPLAEIFVIAFRLPNLFRHLVSEGAFNAAFLPLFTRRLARRHEAGRVFAGRVFALMVTATGALTLLGILGMPLLVAMLAFGFLGDPEKFTLAVHYARIAFPYLALMAMVSVFGAILNATGRFFAGAFAPVLFNLVLIAALMLAYLTGGAAIDHLIWGILVAGGLQLLWVFAVVRRSGFVLPVMRPRLTPPVRRLLKLALPVTLAVGVGQINLVVGTSIATLQAGAAVWLYYADRLYQLPVGVVGVALAVALLADLSRRLADNDVKGAAQSQDRALAIAMLFALPATAGLAVLAEPIIVLLFERGAFTPADSLATARALQAFCVGLPAFILIKTLQPFFFAREDTRTPLIAVAAGVAVNIALALAGFPVFGHLAIALAVSAAGWVMAGYLAVVLAQRGIWRFSWPLLRRLAGQGVAAVLMGGALVLAARFVPPPASFFGLMVWVAAAVSGGVTVFFAAAFLCGGAKRGDLKALRGAA